MAVHFDLDGLVERLRGRAVGVIAIPAGWLPGCGALHDLLPRRADVKAMLALEHNPEIEVTIFYNDIRTSGKGFEELYLRAQAAGVRFFKALPGSITLAQEGQPVIAYEDLATGRQERLTVDLAVLAVGLEGPKTPPPFLDQILNRAFSRPGIPSCTRWKPASRECAWPGPAWAPRILPKRSARPAARPAGCCGCWRNSGTGNCCYEKFTM